MKRTFENTRKAPPAPFQKLVAPEDATTDPCRVTDMEIATIIFDMDGVLIDSEPVHKLAKERAFARFGIRLPETVYERYKGRPDETMMKEVVRSILGIIS